VSEPNPWSLSGDVLENCSCDVVCPGHFTFRNKCTHDYCHAVWAFRIRAGRLGSKDLAGLAVVVIGATPPFMIDGDWRVGIYIDEGADGEQAAALEGIFTGDSGGPWSILSRFVGQRLPTRRCAIRFEEAESGRLSRVEIPGVLSATAEPIRGHDKKNVATLVNLHNTLYEPVHVVARGRFELRDHGMEWTAAERGNHAILTSFDWSSGEPAP